MKFLLLNVLLIASTICVGVAFWTIFTLKDDEVWTPLPWIVASVLLLRAAWICYRQIFGTSPWQAVFGRKR